MKAIITLVSGIDAIGGCQINADVFTDDNVFVLPITISGDSEEIQELVRRQLVLLQQKQEALTQLVVGTEIKI